ncbi:MAG: A/G-specific adenine glycosylase [Planctomycetota bacterium]
MSTAEESRALEAWFAKAPRDLPWRDAPPGGRDPYRTLVSELMLQQTQVSRVIEKFEAFIARFPTARALAAAPEDDVLAAWNGLGYYRRARLLQAAAKAAVERLGGEVPRASSDLSSLPGVGRYTAGAIASLSSNERVAAVDGNAIRVLLRLRGREGSAAETRTVNWAWEEARALVTEAHSPGAFNEALMELGATVCTPKKPACERCPWRDRCIAHEQHLTNQIPAPKPPPKKKDLYATTVVVRDGTGRLLLRRRPDRGLWAGLWEAPTAESGEAHPDAAKLARAARADAPVHAGAFEHITTHRRVRFEVYTATGSGHAPAGARWIDPNDLETVGISNATKRALAISPGLFSPRS